MIRAILFDVGGVLFDSTTSNQRLREFDAMLGWAPDTLRLHLYSGSAWEAVSTGKLSVDAYWQMVGAGLASRLPADFDAFRHNFYGAKLDVATLHLAWRLRTYYQVGLLSNATPLLARDIAVESRFNNLFDVIIISAIEGYRKPDPQAFLLAARRLNLPPTACVLIDDKKRNIDAAAQVGMAGVLHTDARHTEQGLRALGVTLAERWR